ncbi:MAG: hypothetical protein J6T01_04830 [Kiritimatiellae bacterium]|nr:hypothetical protein [Kiritimatiellia bacterium]
MKKSVKRRVGIAEGTFRRAEIAMGCPAEGFAAFEARRKNLRTAFDAVRDAAYARLNGRLEIAARELRSALSAGPGKAAASKSAPRSAAI